MLQPWESAGVNRWWPFCLLLCPAFFFPLFAGIQAHHAYDRIGTETLRSEMSRLRSRATLHCGQLLTLVDVHGAETNRFEQLLGQPWLERYWSNIRADDDPHRIYAAITDSAGTILLHTDPKRERSQLGPGWYNRRIRDADSDVVYAESSPLGSLPVYDQRVPIVLDDRWVGDFHVGLDAEWLDREVDVQRRAALTPWLWMLGTVLLITGAAIYAAVVVVLRCRRLQTAHRLTLRERTRQLAQIGGGLAHEIRNPLHALRINLHTLKRALSHGKPLSTEQIVATVTESDAEIDRLDKLLRDFVEYTSPGRSERGAIDVGREVQAALNLLSEDLRREQITVDCRLPAAPVVIQADPGRFRKIVQNLLTFAQHNAGKNGSVEVRVSENGHGAEISVADSGPSMTGEQLARLFEPFQAPVETGCGLGLALVQCFADEVGGQVTGQSRSPHGTQVRVVLPQTNSAC